MEPDQNQPSIQELARRMVRKLEEEAAADPEGLLASHLAMNRALDAVTDLMGNDSIETDDDDAESDDSD